MFAPPVGVGALFPAAVSDPVAEEEVGRSSPAASVAVGMLSVSVEEAAREGMEAEPEAVAEAREVAAGLVAVWEAVFRPDAEREARMEEASLQAWAKPVRACER